MSLPPPPPRQGAPGPGPGSPGHAPGHAPGQGAYYPDQPYYAPGWSAPVTQPAPRRSRRGLWIALGVLGGLGVAGVTTALVLGAIFLRDLQPLGAVDGPTTAHVGRLDAGHCLTALPADGSVSRVEVVPCSSAHEAEVVGVLTLPDGAWPGTDEVEQRVGAWCEMDNAQLAAGLQPVVWTPTERGWGQGDRDGVCLAWQPDAG